MEEQIETLLKENELLREKNETLNLQNQVLTLDNKKIQAELQVVKKGNAYLKGNITKEVNAKMRLRELEVERKEKTMVDYERKKEYVDDFNKRIELIEEREKNYKEEKKSFFNSVYDDLHKELEKEYLRYSDAYNISNDRNIGYLIGIKKADKLIKDLKLKTNIN